MKHRKTHQRTHHAKGEPTAPVPVSALTRRFPIAAIVGLLIVAAAVVIAIRLVPVKEVARRDGTAHSVTPADASGWRVGMLRPDGLRIVVTGRDDASKVLDAQRFSRSEVRHGYWVATQIPALLNKLYCWCGCENRGVHRSNLQCFEDEMAEDCEVCLGTAEIAYDMTRQGVTDAAQIQAAVDVHWGPNR